MSRGSISSWQDYGRRSSQGIPQFSGGPVEFMTSDGMEYKRGDGWFLSYTKIAGIVVVFVIGVVAAGFLGWYINSLPKKKPYDTLDLLNDEIEDVDNVGEISISPLVHPLKYRLELTPMIDADGLSTVKGRVIIEFEVKETSLNKLSLNAKNITVDYYKLSSTDPEKDKDVFREKRALDEISYNIQRNDETIVMSAMYAVENDFVVTIADNGTIIFENNIQYPSENSSHYADKQIANSQLPALPENISSEIEIKEYKIDDEKDIHTVSLATELQPGVYFLDIDYEVSLQENAFFIKNYSSTEDEKWLMGTKLKRSGARYLFPVFDDVLHKSNFSLSIIHSKETKALSNMPLRTTRDTSNSSMVIDTFDESPPFSPHNLAFLLGHVENISVIEDSEMVATFWTESKRESQDIYVFDKFNSTVANLIDVFDMPYPLPKIDVVALPARIDENMASPGLIAIKQSLFYATKNSPTIIKTNALRVLISLLEQQWTDEFTNVNRTDAWIFEGSMIYFQHDIVQKIDSSLIDYFIGDVQLHAMDVDGYSISRPLHENVNYRSLHSVDDENVKGACLIRMLHGAINDTAFRNGYKKVVNRWKYNTTDVADFLNIMAEEATELPSGISLEEAMSSWIFQGGYPLITVIRNYDKGSAIIYQEQFTLDRPLESISKLWHIPLDYVEENGNWSSPQKLWFQPESKIQLDIVGSNQSWIVFNINKTGYYRVHYDEANWKLLKLALEKNHELFPAETRASLIDDIFSLAAVGLIKYETVFDFIEYMRTKERHYLPWTILMRYTFKLNRLLYETSAFSDFQIFMVKFVSPLYSEVVSKLDEGSQLTLIAVKMACMFEHAECLSWANNAFENARNDSGLQEIVPSYIRESFYCTVARYGTRKEWNYFTEMVTMTEDEEEKKRLLSAFACFQAPWILQSVLNEILHEGIFNQDEISVILRSFPRNPAAAQAASRFVRANWQEITQRFPGSYSVLKSFVLSMINGITTEQDLEDLQLFRENNYDSMKGVRYAAALVEANGNFETLWLKNSLPEIEKLLKEVSDMAS